MARRIFRRMAWLAKVEATYGTDAVPTGAANAIQVSDVTVTPLQGDQVRRDLIMPYFGDQGMVIAGAHATIQGSVEIAGSGTPGTTPGYAPLLRACGLAEIVTAGQKVEYKPVSGTPDAVSCYMLMDGVRHAFVGARGTLTLSLAPKQIPRFQFTLTGLLGPVTDQALPVANYGGFPKPLVASKANSTFSLHGLAAPMESFSFDLGNQVEPRMLIGAESIEIVDRRVSGTAVIEAVSTAEKNWYAIALASTRGALVAKHGTIDGNIVELDAAAVQIGPPAYGNSQGVLTNSLPLIFSPVTGDDEFTLRIR